MGGRTDGQKAASCEPRSEVDGGAGWAPLARHQRFSLSLRPGDVWLGGSQRPHKPSGKKMSNLGLGWGRAPETFFVGKIARIRNSNRRTHLGMGNCAPVEPFAADELV